MISNASAFLKRRGANCIVTCQRMARQRLDKHPAKRARNDRTNVYTSLLGNSQVANGLARYLSRDLFSVWSALCNSRTVFSALSVPELYNKSPLAAKESRRVQHLRAQGREWGVSLVNCD
jgi:hypothetical protein